MRELKLTAPEYFKRAQALSPVELWEKSWWRLSKTARCCRFYSKFHRSSVYAVHEMIDPTFQKNATAEDIYDRFRTETKAQFFFDETDRQRIVAQTRALEPDAAVAVLAEAERILDNRFYVHGFGEVFFKDQVSWLAGSKPYRDKLLSRHDFIPTLIQAYWYTSDRRFAERAVKLWRDWIATPYRLKLENSVDDSIRIQNWLWLLYGLRTEDLFGPAEFVLLLSEAYRFGFRIETGMMYAANHRVIEALGLWCIGIFFPELRRALRWRSKGERILLEEIGRQVFADGVHMEMSSGYHVFVSTHFLKFYVLSSINNYFVAEQFRARLVKMLEFVEALRKPDGEIPMLGDTDAQSTMDREHREAKLLGPALSLVKSGGKSMTRSPGDLVPWYLGRLIEPAGTFVQDGKVAAKDGKPRSRLFPNAGYVVMRSGCVSKGHYMLMDAGRFGMDSFGHHGHADALHVEICTSGVSLVIDPGGYGYVGDRWRQFFRSTRAHSTVQVDGKNQSEMFGVFGTGRTAQCKIATWFTSDKMDFVEASHDGYQPVLHHRAILFVKESPSYWIILDRLEGEGEHTLELLFHLTAEAHCHAQDTGEVIVRQSRSRSTLMRSLNFPPDKLTVIVGQTEPEIQGWVSRTTGSCEPAPVVSFKKTALLPQTFATLVHPEYSQEKILSLRPWPGTSADDHLDLGCELVWPNVTDKVCIDRPAFIAQRRERRLPVSIERSRAGKAIWRETAGHNENQSLQS